MATKYHLVRLSWDEDLFSKKGVSTSAIFGSGSDAVLSCSLSGRPAYVHPASGLALIHGGVEKNIGHVIKGCTWKGKQYIKGRSVEKIISDFEQSDDFEISKKEINIDNSDFSVLNKLSLDINDGLNELDYRNGSIRTDMNVYCPSFLQIISSHI